jgi:hypothetical protein
LTPITTSPVYFLQLASNLSTNAASFVQCHHATMFAGASFVDSTGKYLVSPTGVTALQAALAHQHHGVVAFLRERFGGEAAPPTHGLRMSAPAPSVTPVPTTPVAPAPAALTVAPAAIPATRDGLLTPLIPTASTHRGAGAAIIDDAADDAFLVNLLALFETLPVTMDGVEVGRGQRGRCFSFASVV